MHSYNVRISHPYDAISSWIAQLEAPQVLAVQHEADSEVFRTHTHILVIDSPVASLALKHKLKRMYPEISLTKGDWAFPELKDRDFEHIATYYLKGTLEPSFVKGLSFDWEVIRSRWVDRKIQTQLKYTDPHKMNYQEML